MEHFSSLLLDSIPQWSRMNTFGANIFICNAGGYLLSVTFHVFHGPFKEGAPYHSYSYGFQTMSLKSGSSSLQPRSPSFPPLYSRFSVSQMRSCDHRTVKPRLAMSTDTKVKAGVVFSWPDSVLPALGRTPHMGKGKVFLIGSFMCAHSLFFFYMGPSLTCNICQPPRTSFTRLVKLVSLQFGIAGRDSLHTQCLCSGL